MNKLKKRNGMTMAELLIVVAIIAVLGGVAFVSIVNHQRSLGQLERDGIAKEIFVAAQNHLTAVYGQGYMGITDFGSEDTTSKDENEKDIKGDYYVVSGSGSKNSVLDLMLPFGSIDETVRSGGSYIIHYQKDTGTVLDVFYCNKSGQYNHTFFEGDDYAYVVSKAGDDKKGERKNYVNGSILGWYGGAAAAELAKAKLDPPTIKVVNAEKLYVEITDPNTFVTDSDNESVDVYIRLLVKGLSSDTEHYIDVEDTSDPIVLDDITSKDEHFANREFDDIDGVLGNEFIPGENITIQVVAYTKDILANIAYSSKVTTNSLFESIRDVEGSPDKIYETAYISNIRHLENLDALVSNLGSQIEDDDLEQFSISNAKQTTNFSWDTFKSKIGSENVSVCYSSASGMGYDPTSETKPNCYYPIVPDYNLIYDGQRHSISDVKVDVTGAAGLFGSTSTVSQIKNLELIDFNITGSTSETVQAASAGALAGTLSGCTVTNVLARNSAASSTNKIKATAVEGGTADAGGLIGKITGSGAKVQYSAAAVIVNGTTNAGGLIGDASTSSGTITHCYSAGHTKDGDYKTWAEETGHTYDVTGATAGGLVGTSAASISNSYSTCSVSGSSKAGGFAGTASAGIDNCYATGLIDQTQNTGDKYAFLGSGVAPLSKNYYYKIVNVIPSTDANAIQGETEPMPPVSGEYEEPDADAKVFTIKPIDMNVSTYDDFVGPYEGENGGGWKPARALDSTLVKYYGGKYTFRTVQELNPALPTEPTGYENWNQLYVMVHYGDWPAPEIFFINE